MLMERNTEIIRGWPYDGSLDRAEPIKVGVTLSNGDWVAKQSDGTVDKSGASASSNVGLVMVGNGDSGSAAASGKAVVVWSNFIAKIANYTAGSYAPGDNVTVKSGKIAVYTASDPIIGTVLEVVAATAGSQTAHLVVLVK